MHTERLQLLSPKVHLELSPEVPIGHTAEEGGEQVVKEEGVPDQVVEEEIADEVRDGVPEEGGHDDKDEEGATLLHCVLDSIPGRKRRGGRRGNERGGEGRRGEERGGEGSE